MSETNKREASTAKLSDILGKELEATGSDIAEGSHPGTLFGYSEPFTLTTQFAKAGQPTTRTVFEMRFGVYDKDGVLAEVTYLVPAPETGKVHRLSNLFKATRALAAGDSSIIEGDNLAKGFKLTALIGRNCVLSIKKNEKGFPQVDAIAGKMNGAKYPSLEDCQKNLTGSQGTPF